MLVFFDVYEKFRIFRSRFQVLLDVKDLLVRLEMNNHLFRRFLKGTKIGAVLSIIIEIGNLSFRIYLKTRSSGKGFVCPHNGSRA